MAQFGASNLTSFVHPVYWVSERF